MNDKCLLDKNIVMDLIEKRPRLENIKSEVFSNFTEFYISSSTFLTIFYLSRKLRMTKDELFQEMKNFEILAVAKDHCMEGLEMAKTAEDVEDCVEISIASENKLTFITADQELREVYYKKCKMKVIV
jgi:rRNA-processing protein FCF1